MAQRTCDQCGGEFAQPARGLKSGRPRRFCSTECSEAHKSADKRRKSGRDQPRPCQRCGKGFVAIGRGHHAYCPDCSTCGDPECPRPRERGNWCAMHADRVVKKGRPGPTNPLGPGPKPGLKPVLDSHGYERVYLGQGKYIGRHRLVMEEQYGRELFPFERPHHKNGIRHDNRPENLELWVTPHPSGQRPEDLVAWVVEFYPELVVAEQRARKHEKQSGQVRLLN